MQGMGSAGQWTSRNILQPVALPFRSCYSLSSRTAQANCMPRLGDPTPDDMLVAPGMDELLLSGLSRKVGIIEFCFLIHMSCCLVACPERCVRGVLG